MSNSPLSVGGALFSCQLLRQIASASVTVARSFQSERKDLLFESPPSAEPKESQTTSNHGFSRMHTDSGRYCPLPCHYVESTTYVEFTSQNIPSKGVVGKILTPMDLAWGNRRDPPRSEIRDGTWIF